MLQDFKNNIESKFPQLLTQPFLIACSGGVDSMVLMHLCNALNLNFAIAHCNFNLRGKASDGDAELVRLRTKK